MREVGLAAILRGVDETAEHLGLSSKYVKDCVGLVMRGDKFFDAVQKMVWDSVKNNGEQVTAKTYKLSLDTLRRFTAFMRVKDPKSAHEIPVGPVESPAKTAREAVVTPAKTAAQAKPAKKKPSKANEVDFTEWFVVDPPSKSPPPEPRLKRASTEPEPALMKHLKRPEVLDEPAPHSFVSPQDFVGRLPSTSVKTNNLVDAATKAIMIAEVQRTGNALEVADKYGVDVVQLRYWVTYYYKTGKVSESTISEAQSSNELSEAYSELLRDPVDID